MSNPVSDLIDRARRDGWAKTSLDLYATQAALAYTAWTPLPNRTNGPLVDTLRPVDSAEARPHSLSATSGKGEQPLHTDGAHHPTPPDIVLLIGKRPSTIPTVLWTRPPDGLPASVEIDVQHGLFVVSPGGPTFLAPALLGSRMRYDPGCMAPADERATRVANYFANVRSSATDHYWDEPNLVLAIDNTRTLHARGDATDDPHRTLHRLALRAPKDSR